jgi:tetratricopeptide (TPR) repeat protein
MRRLGGRWAVVFLAATAIGRATHGDETWVGKRVIPRPGVVLEMEGGAAKGQARSPFFHIYRVERNDGATLLLVAEDDRARVRARPDQVIPFERAIDELTSIIAAEPKRADAHIWRGFDWFVRREFDKAFDDYDQACRLDPKNSKALEARSSAWFAKGQVDRSIADLSEAIRLKPEASLYITRANVRRAVRQLDAAIADDSEAIRLEPRSALARYNRGTVFSDKGNLDGAIADFTEAIRLDPWFALAFGARGQSWARKGQTDLAIADDTEAIRLDPNLAIAYVDRGRARISRREYDLAIADLDAAIRIEPKPPSVSGPAYTARAVLWAASPNAKDRDGRKAVDAARKAVELTQERSAAAFEALAAALAEAGDFSHAEDAQRRAVSLATMANPSPERLETIIDRVGLYAAGKPYRLPAGKK